MDRKSLPIELGGSSEDSEKKEFFKDILEKEEVFAGILFIIYLIDWIIYYD